MALTQISTAGVKDDAVTSGKIPANAVGSSELADNAVDTAAIADDAVTADKLANTSVTAASYGSATAIPAITIDAQGRITAASTNNVNIPAGTTINNNADNRVITGSGTANTLEGESGLTYDGATLNISNDIPQLFLTDTNSNNSYGRVRGNGGHLGLSADHGNATAGSIIFFEIDGSEQARITASGNVGIANNTPTAWGSGIPTVEFKGTGNTSRGGAIAFESQSGSNGYNVIYSDSGNLRIYGGATNRASAAEKVMFPATGGITFNGDTATANALDDYEEGSWTPAVAEGTASAVGNCRYVKIGRMVHITGGISNLSNRTSTSGIQITGFPFPLTFIESAKFTCSLSKFNQQSGGQGAMVDMLHNTSTAYPGLQANGNQGGPAIRHTDAHNTASSIIFSGTYTTG